MGYFCEKLNNELSCFPQEIRACCSEHTDPPIYIKPMQMERKMDLSVISELKKLFFQNIQNIENSTCNKCFYLRPMKEGDFYTPKYKHLDISHWVQCNCNCLYCVRMGDYKNEKTSRARKSSYYDMLPILKGLYKHDLLDKENLRVLFHGGDVTVLKEFPQLIKELYKNGFYRAFILTNNIIYQPLIEKLLRDNKGGMTTSLDSGSRETYFKLKRVDKFDSCISNLKQYIKKSQDPTIKVKYIIVEKINDNIEEIEKFLDLMYSIGISRVEFVIDSRYLHHTMAKQELLPAHYLYLLQFFKEKCHQLNLNLFIEDLLEDVINKSFPNSNFDF